MRLGRLARRASRPSTVDRSGRAQRPGVLPRRPPCRDRYDERDHRADAGHEQADPQGQHSTSRKPMALCRWSCDNAYVTTTPSPPSAAPSGTTRFGPRRQRPRRTGPGSGRDTRPQSVGCADCRSCGRACGQEGPVPRVRWGQREMGPDPGWLRHVRKAPMAGPVAPVSRGLGDWRVAAGSHPGAQVVAGSGI